jgi:hypothetical protein
MYRRRPGGGATDASLLAQSGEPAFVLELGRDLVPEGIDPTALQLVEPPVPL